EVDRLRIPFARHHDRRLRIALDGEVLRGDADHHRQRVSPFRPVQVEGGVIGVALRPCDADTEVGWFTRYFLRCRSSTVYSQAGSRAGPAAPGTLSRRGGPPSGGRALSWPR